MLCFDVYGIKIKVEVKSKYKAELIKLIKDDFGFFESNSEFINTHCAILVSDSDFEKVYNTKHHTLIAAAQLNELFELFKYYFLFFVGLELELKGFMRLHAIGISENSENTVYYLPSGAGKSTHAMRIVTFGNAKIFSDEIIFTNGTTILPFPICISLSDNTLSTFNNVKTNYFLFKKKDYPAKYLIPIAHSKVAPSGKLNHVVIANMHPLIFIWNSFWGLGLPQMKQYLMNKNNILKLVKMAFVRIRVLAVLFLRKKILFKTHRGYFFNTSSPYST